jgi:hypothetical protein
MKVSYRQDCGFAALRQSVTAHWRNDLRADTFQM